MQESGLDYLALREELRKFAEERDWEQFHTPKNLAMALGAEAGELLEVFQWLTPSDSRDMTDDQMQAAATELADVVIYAVRLADVAGIDLPMAIKDKIRSNARRYPPDIVRGSAAKRPLSTSGGVNE
jgi:dCTP diphosphatase